MFGVSVPLNHPFETIKKVVIVCVTVALEREIHMSIITKFDKKYMGYTERIRFAINEQNEHFRSAILFLYRWDIRKPLIIKNA